MSVDAQDLEELVSEASRSIGRVWPLYSFVTSNPLSGYENENFRTAIQRARSLLGGGGYPSGKQFQQALQDGLIRDDLLEEKLSNQEINASAEELIEKLVRLDERTPNKKRLGPRERSLNQILEKWFSGFLDEGRSRWSMPYREKGFYRAWTLLAPHDGHIPNNDQLEDLPRNKTRAIGDQLEPVPESDWENVFIHHLTALPGWAGYIKQRSKRNKDPWSTEYPADLLDYLAVRLVLADHLDATVVPDSKYFHPPSNSLDEVRHCLLEAWEESFRSRLREKIQNTTAASNGSSPEGRPAAQMVFCIDTRSEIIRRHIESTGDYETHGYAGFFGLPIQHQRWGETTTINACPPIVDPVHEVYDVPRPNDKDRFKTFESWNSFLKTLKTTLKNLKDNVGSAFNYVELSGPMYGLEMVSRTIFPGFRRRLKKSVESLIPDYFEVTETQLNPDSPSHGEPSPDGMSLEERVQYAESAFDLMGWTSFAPLVVFVGHTSDTENNPFDSSLQCGACSGNSGAPNARILASICNDQAVRKKLRERGWNIPEDTVFLAGCHTTTTDEIELFDSHLESVPEQLDRLREDLEEARRNATAERIQSLRGDGDSSSVRGTEARSADWAQTRPEWGLAGNASFLVGPNQLRQEVDLEGRVFLHSYDWRQDPDGSALEAIMTGPLVVCQWINHQYYFSTVDNAFYGSGSKITHNPVGNFGVLQGNGGDLMGGLPLQSVKLSDREFQHKPIRILNLIHAPEQRVRRIIENHDQLQNLVNNDWIALEVIDPERENKFAKISTVSREEAAGKPTAST